MISALTQEILQRLAGAAGLWLFLDYDGTLAEFAPTPDDVIPDPQLIQLIKDLVERGRARVAIISGRRLEHIQTLLPVPGILLAGTYGIEMLDAEGNKLNRLDLASIRPVLEMIKKRWVKLITGKQGFFLEDKGWALALHARFASEKEAREVLAAARAILDESGLDESFRILGGTRFLEIGPAQANKGQTVRQLLERFTWPEATLVYVGDDDKDEEAFAAIRKQGGLAVVVAAAPRETLANYRLESPAQVRVWLSDLILRLEDSAD